MDTEIHLTFSQIASIVQLLGLPILGWMLVIAKKFYRKMILNDLKHDAMVFALQKSFKNGFTEYYNEKLSELKDEKRFIDNK